jgi:amidase
MGVAGPMARNVSDLALLLSVQAGYDARAPLSIDGDGSIFRRVPEVDCKGKRVAWGGDLGGHAPCEPGVLAVCESALAGLESLGCHVDPARPDYDLDAVWQAVVALRAWQMMTELLPHYRDPKQRALLKPEALYEVETGLKLSAQDITAASVVRTEWYQAVRRFFERYDYWILPTAQVFPFPLALHWPDRIAGRPMQSYHEWMKTQLLVTMSGCPALAAPAGFDASGLPMGIQIVAPNHRELDCLQLARAYEQVATSTLGRLPALLS